jgi:hypothetical protein
MNVNFSLFGETARPTPIPQPEPWYDSEVFKVCAVALTVFALTSSAGYAILFGTIFLLRGPILAVAFAIFCLFSMKSKSDSTRETAV